MNNLFLRS